MQAIKKRNHKNSIYSTKRTSATQLCFPSNMLTAAADSAVYPMNHHNQAERGTLTRSDAVLLRSSQMFYLNQMSSLSHYQLLDFLSENEKQKWSIHTEIANTIAIVISGLGFVISKYAYICSPTSNCIVFGKHYAAHYLTAMLISPIEMEWRSFKVTCLVLNFLWRNCKQWAVTANGQRGWMLTGHGHTTHHRALIQHIVD